MMGNHQYVPFIDCFIFSSLLLVEAAARENKYDSAMKDVGSFMFYFQHKDRMLWYVIYFAYCARKL